MNTKSMIAELILQAQPVKRLPHMRICAEWIAITAISFAAIGLLYGFRPDLPARMAEPWFLLEMALNAMLILAAGCVATAFSYPDRAKALFLKPMLLLIFAGYSALTLMIAFTQPNVTHDVVNTAPHGIECLLCILSFAAVPAIWMFWRLRQLASTKPMQMGAAAILMAVATGCLGVRLVETEIESAGLILWHYAPLVTLAALGIVLGKKIFRW